MRFRRRLLLLYVVFCAALGVVWLRALQLQAFDGDTWERAARDLRRQEERLEALRGPIVSRDGVVLAEDVPVCQIAVVGWEWTHRERARCTGCGLVHFPRASGRLPRRCACGVGKDGAAGRIERLEDGDLGPLERALGVEEGELAARADARVAAIVDLVEAYRVRLQRELDDTDFLIDDKVELRQNDLMMRPYVVVADAPEAAVRLVQTDEVGRYRGFRVQTALRRRYPLGDFAPQLLGYASVVNSHTEYEELVARFGDRVTLNTRRGRRGLERAYNWSLHGTPGRRLLELEPAGAFTHVVEDEPPVPGRPLRLNLSARVSRDAEKILAHWANEAGYFPAGRPSGAFVALDADTGDVLVWAELPRFDLNTQLEEIFDPALVEAKPIREERLWTPRHPDDLEIDLETWRTKLVVPVPVSLSRVAEVAVEPGSTFKPLIALAMLESGVGLPYRWFDCGSRSTKPHCHRCGEVDLFLAIARSCNQYFAFSLRDSPRWNTYRHSVGAFVDRLGIGRRPGGELREWSSGQWLWDWVDFPLDQAVAHAETRLRKTMGASAPALNLTLSPRTPGTVGGDPERLGRLLADVCAHVARLSGADALVVHVRREDNDGRQVVLRFGVRAARRPTWDVLPEPVHGKEALPPVLRPRVKWGTAGSAGSLARGGTVWFTVRFERRIGREDPSSPPVIRPDDGRNVAIGQGPVLATPLQMARAMAVLANGGTLVEPHVVKAVGPATRRGAGTRIEIDPSHLAVVRAGMEAVANSEVGTARKQAWHLVPGTVYGKTGTSQVGASWRPWAPEDDEEGPWHHWFAGWAEGYGPRKIAFACLLHSRTEAAAGLTAAGAAQQILTRWYEVHGEK